MDVKKRKRLLGLIHGLHMGGAQKMMLSILNHFSSKGYDVHLIVFKKEGILEKELDSRISVHHLNTNSVMKGMGKCLKCIYEVKPDIVFSGIGHLNLALAPFIVLMRLFLPKVKWIARETNIVSLQNQEAKYPKLFDWLYTYVYKNYDHIVAQSKDMKEDLEQNYGLLNRVEVINNPVDILKIERLAHKSNESDVQLFNEAKINLLSVAGLRLEKRQDLMLKVMALLDDKYHLILIGDGAEREKLEALAKRLNILEKVSFLGTKENPYAYMKQADLLLLTSQREGFPNVLIEANSVGLAIVAFASLGGITEIIDEGVNGFTVPFGEIELMAKKIEEASAFSFDKEKIKSMSTARYSHNIILEKYEQLFNR